MLTFPSELFKAKISFLLISVQINIYALTWKEGRWMFQAIAQLLSTSAVLAKETLFFPQASLIYIMYLNTH